MKSVCRKKENFIRKILVKFDQKITLGIDYVLINNYHDFWN